MRKYKERSKEVEAIMFDGHNLKECKEFMGDSAISTEHNLLIVPTVVGNRVATEGDWIVKEESTFVLCASHTFHSWYEVNLDAEPVPRLTVGEVIVGQNEVALYDKFYKDYPMVVTQDIIPQLIEWLQDAKLKMEGYKGFKRSTKKD